MKAIICIGCSASGKSTYAESLVGFVEINRDNVRKYLLDTKFKPNYNKLDSLWKHWNFKHENEVSKIVQEKIQECVLKKSDIVISDTNLNANRRLELERQLIQFGYTIEHKIFGQDMTIEELWKRDEQRKDTVGRDVLIKQYIQFRQQYPKWKLKNSTGKPKAIIVDVDGTITLGPHDRNPYEWDKVDQDLPNKVVIQSIANQYDNGIELIFMSGRDSICRDKTEKWIKDNIAPYSQLCSYYGQELGFHLHMRQENDTRKDWIVKQELFMKHVDGKYDVVAVFDDRPTVILNTWLEMGLNTICVGNPYLTF